MPYWIARKLWRRVPWGLVWAAAVWLVEKGRDRVNRNLTKRERQELINLVAKSRGRPGNLHQRERTRVKNIVGRAVRG